MLYPSDKKLDKNQKFQPPKKFQALSSNDLVKLKNWIYNLVTAGQGIRIERSNDRVIVHAETAGKGFGGMGTGSGLWMKTATTKAGLEEPVSEVYFGRVTAGAQQGMVCVRNPDNDGWDAINFFE